MSTCSLVMTVIGEDRPGLVEALSGLVRAHQGNWLESRMCHLGGRFAGLLRVEVPANQEDKLILALDNLEAGIGLKVTVQRDQPQTRAPGRTFQLELVGNDRPGIISHISRVLASHRVNVEALETYTESAPMAGGLLFHARAILHLPVDCQANHLQADLETLASDLMVDLKLHDQSEERSGC